MRSDSKYDELIKEAKQFATDHNLTEVDFKETRKRSKKTLPGEENSDDVHVQLSAFKKYRCDTYFKVLDKVIMSIQSSFSDSCEILKDLNLLAPERVLSFKKDNLHLPKDSFVNLVDWVPEIDFDQLRNEFVIFAKRFDDIMSEVNLPTFLHEEVTIKSSSESSEEKINIKKGQENKTKICVTTIINVLSKYELSVAFPNLYTAYKVLGTIPVSSASAERSFSKVQYPCSDYKI